MSMMSGLFIIVGLSSLSGVYRLLKGPTVTDQVIGLDFLFASAIMLCLLAAWHSQSTVYIDVAIGLALTGLVATLAWSKTIVETHAETNQTNAPHKETPDV